MGESIGLITAFLVGGIPTGVLISKFIHKKDVRNFGSTNPGAVNIWRTFGLGYGLVVVCIDTGKGYFAAGVLPRIIAQEEPQEVFLLLGLAAVVGHIWSPWLHFKGGKGVATVLGVALAIYPLAAAVCVFTWFLTVTFTRYASVSSLASAVCFPMLVSLIYHPSKYGILLTILVPLLLSYTHRSNLQRLRYGKELKIGSNR